jgi:DNA-binding NarL/FixJ family response regulator
MIADDKAIIRDTLRSLIETRADWQVCGEATSGRQAVEQAAELKPDMIILDLEMPGRDGLQAARDIVSAFPDVPILLYTACAFSPEAKLEARKCGVRDVINKGASPEQLMGAIESLLTPKTRSAAEEAQPASLPVVAPPESDPQPN